MEREGLDMEVQTKHARLDTLAVTIQALHVNGKQMTLAVFRQLPACDLLLNTGELDPSLRAWGIVRYRIADESDLWAVVEKQGMLFRAPIFTVNQREAERWVKAKQERLASKNNDLAEAEENLIEAQDSGYVTQFHTDKIVRKKEAACAAWRELLDAYKQLDYQNKAAHAMDSLRNLPQLFIAV